MFEPFSRGYYLGRLYVEPYGGDRPVIASRQHEQTTEALYADGVDGATDTDGEPPLVMKVETVHLAVHGDDGVPPDTLAVPEDVLEETRIRNPPSLREILLAKADTASRLLRLGTTAT
ncbi:MAG: DUF5802 family protein [Halobacteriaceae archaeon]